MGRAALGAAVPWLEALVRDAVKSRRCRYTPCCLSVEPPYRSTDYGYITHHPGTVRATEHQLGVRVGRALEMEGRASKLQAERRALIEERSRSAKALALQRAAVQDQFKRCAHNQGPHTRPWSQP
jgi:hypothetical protein